MGICFRFLWANLWMGILVDLVRWIDVSATLSLGFNSNIADRTFFFFLPWGDGWGIIHLEDIDMKYEE